MPATATSNYVGQAMRVTTALAPPSLANTPALLAGNLFVMTVAMCLGLTMAGKKWRRIAAFMLRYAGRPRRPGAKRPIQTR